MRNSTIKQTSAELLRFKREIAIIQAERQRHLDDISRIQQRLKVLNMESEIAARTTLRRRTL